MVKRENPRDNDTAATAGDNGDYVTGEVTASAVDGFSESELRDVQSMADVLRMTGGEVTNIADVIGDGFAVLDNKSALLDVQFAIVRCAFHKSEKGSNGEFATLHVVTEDGRKLVVNDGGTGIYAQVKEASEQYGRVAPMLVPRGLRASTYDYQNPATGETTEATTYYLNTAK